jgi:hypothetical protein
MCTVPIIDNEANDFNYFRGNKYSKIKLVLTVEIVTLETMKRDTLSNGKIIVRSFPGQIAQVPVDEQETYLRQNSVRVTMLIIVMVINNPLNIIILENQSQMMLRKIDKMYNSPKHNVNISLDG